MRGIIGALVCAVIVAVPGAASADQAVVKDDKGDVYRDADGTPGGGKPKGSVVNTDVLRTSVRHGNQAVKVKVRYAALTKDKSKFISFDADIRVPNEGVFHAVVMVDRDLRSAFVYLTDGDYTQLECTGLKARAVPDKELLLAHVPRACIGSPKWIRVRGTATSVKAGGDQVGYYDNAPEGSVLTKRLYAG